MLAASVPEFRRTVDVVVVAGSRGASRARPERGSREGEFCGDQCRSAVAWWCFVEGMGPAGRKRPAVREDRPTLGESYAGRHLRRGPGQDIQGR
jgi:hypothetical protein